VDTPVSLQFYGVDISAAMTVRAQARECYNRVVHAEVHAPKLHCVCPSVCCFPQ
jgi:predicted TPR repeat methyltransferase